MEWVVLSSLQSYQVQRTPQQQFREQREGVASVDRKFRKAARRPRLHMYLSYLQLGTFNFDDGGLPLVFGHGSPNLDAGSKRTRARLGVVTFIGVATFRIECLVS